jgi:WD40 repeat protein
VGFYFATGSGDSVARIWRTDIPFPIRNFVTEGSAHVQIVKWHPSCQLIAIGSTNSLAIHDVGSPSELFRFNNFRNCTAIGFSPSGYLVAAANAERLTVWELKTGSEIFSFNTLNTIVGISWSYPSAAGLGDGGLRGVTGVTGTGHPVLVTVEQGGKLRVWDKLFISKASVSELSMSHPIRPLHMRFTPRNLLVVGGTKEASDVSSVQQLGGPTVSNSMLE